MGITPVNTVKTVTTAGTRVQLTTSTIHAPIIYFEGLKTNTGYIYVGLSDVSSTQYITCLSAGEGLTLSPDGVGNVRPVSGEINLSSIWFDSSVSGEKVMITYIQRVG